MTTLLRAYEFIGVRLNTTAIYPPCSTNPRPAVCWGAAPYATSVACSQIPTPPTTHLRQERSPGTTTLQHDFFLSSRLWACGTNEFRGGHWRGHECGSVSTAPMIFEHPRRATRAETEMEYYQGAPSTSAQSTPSARPARGFGDLALHDSSFGPARPVRTAPGYQMNLSSPNGTKASPRLPTTVRASHQTHQVNAGEPPVHPPGDRVRSARQTAPCAHPDPATALPIRWETSHTYDRSTTMLA